MLGQEVLVDVMQTDYGYTHDPEGYLLLKITQLIELLGIRHCVPGRWTSTDGEHGWQEKQRENGGKI